MKLIKLIILIALIALPIGANASSYPYATLSDVTATAENMNVKMRDNSTPVVSNHLSRNGWNISEQGICVDISDNYLYDVNNYRNIFLEIEFYNGSYGGFKVRYSKVGGDMGETEYVWLDKNDMWQTYVFKLDDADFSNRAEFNDFIVDAYPGTTAVIGSIRLTADNSYSPIIINALSDNIGNIFFGNEKQRFYVEYKNKTAQSLSFSVNYTVLDEEGAPCKTIDGGNETIGAFGSIERSIMADVDSYGIFELQIALTNDDINVIKEIPFSHCVLNSSQNRDFGVNTHLLSNSWRGSLTEEICEVIQKAGMGGVREAIVSWYGFEPTKGNYAIPERNRDTLDIIVKNDLELLNILGWGNPNYGGTDSRNDILLTEDQLPAFYDFVYNLSLQLEPWGVNNFEVWNEPLSAGDSSDHAKKYADMAKTAYTAVKAATPSAQVGIISTKSVYNGDYNYMTNVLSHMDNKYYDAISIHGYAGWAKPAKYTFPLVNAKNIGEAIAAFLKPVTDHGYSAQIWNTEYGFRTWTGNNEITTSLRADYQRQAYWTLHEYFLTKEVLPNSRHWYYAFMDSGLIPFESEQNWGMIKNFKADTPYQAKPLLPAVANMNNLIGNAQNCTLVYKSGYSYVHKFTGQDETVYVLWSGDNEDEIAVSNVPELENAVFYDVYGNKIPSIISGSCYQISEAPVYACLEDANTQEYSETTDGFESNTVTIKGISTTPMSMVVLKPGYQYGEQMDQGIAYFGSAVSDERGMYEFSYKTQETTEGLYTAYITGESRGDIRIVQFTVSGNMTVDLTLRKGAIKIDRLNALAHGDIVNAFAQIKESFEDTPCMLVCALYKEDALLDLVFKKGLIKGKDTKLETDTITFREDATNIKLFLWNGINLSPITDELKIVED